MSNRIHRYWTGDAPRPASSILAGRIASGFGDLTDWTDESLPGPITDLLDQHAEEVPEDQRPKHRANIVRYALLSQFGGLWMDHDVVLMNIPFRGMSPWIAASNSHIVNSIIFSPAGDPHLSQAIAAISPADTSYEASGGGMLERIWTDVQRINLPWSYEGVRDREVQPWALHFWASKS